MNHFFAPPSLKPWTIFYFCSTYEPFLINAILVASGRAKERDGWVWPSTTSHGRVCYPPTWQTGYYFPSDKYRVSTWSEFRIWIRKTGWKIDCTARVALSEDLPVFDNAAALPAHGVGRPRRMLQLVPSQHNSQEPSIVYEHNYLNIINLPCLL